MTRRVEAFLPSKSNTDVDGYAPPTSTSPGEGRSGDQRSPGSLDGSKVASSTSGLEST